MKYDAIVRMLEADTGASNDIIVPVDADYVDSTSESIKSHVAESEELHSAFGYTPSCDEFEVVNLDELLQDMRDAQASIEPDYSEDCDYNCLKKKIAGVLRRYFDYDDNGDPNPEFDDTYTAQAAIDDIHAIVGDI